MLALPAALMPTSCMQQINAWLLVDPLPVTPLVEYLTHSVSGLYACLGLVTWFLAADVRRYRPVIAVKSIAGMSYRLATSDTRTPPGVVAGGCFGLVRKKRNAFSSSLQAGTDPRSRP